jgi:hypothetical protein
MVEQEALDLMAEAAPDEPEKVQDEARFATSATSGAEVTCGAGTGVAKTALLHSASARAAELRRGAMLREMYEVNC